MINLPDNFNSLRFAQTIGSDAQAKPPGKPELQAWAAALARQLCFIARTSFDAKFPEAGFDPVYFSEGEIASMLLEAGYDVVEREEHANA